MRRGLVFLVLGTILLLAPSANAQQPPDWGTPFDPREPFPPGSPALEPPARRPDESPVWYGWQPLLSDVATVLTTAGLAGLPNQATLTLGTGFVGYGLAPPIIHLAHGRPVIALLDLAIRVSAPAVGFWAGGSVTANCGQNNPESGNGGCQVVGQLLGAGLGALAAVVVDAAVLSWEWRATPEPATETARSFTLSPSLLLTKEHTGLGLYGTF
jgi:hypothetical protein